LQSEYYAVLCRLWGCGWQSRDHAGLAGLGSLAGKVEIVQSWVAQPSKMELLQGCTGLGGCGLVEFVNVCGSLDLRANPTEILQD
jgi:hypothetical protein